MPNAPSIPALSVRDLRVTYAPGEEVVCGWSFDVAPGQVLAIVGESGAGKSSAGLALLDLLPRRGARSSAAALSVAGEDLLGLSPAERRTRNGRRIGMTFQDPATALDPYVPIATQVAESVRRRPGLAKADVAVAADALLSEVGLAELRDRGRVYAHELSGGQQQRALLAVALGGAPAVLVADELTSALDATLRVRVLALLDRLRRERQLAVVAITHDLDVVARLADEVLVVYAGHACEHGPARAVLETPLHPYTQALLAARPTLHTDVGELRPLPGRPPRPGECPPGCPFAPRCPLAAARCATLAPVLRSAGPGRSSACWRNAAGI